MNKKIDKAKKNGFPIIKCDKCGKLGFVLEGEGITSTGKHYPIGECIYCN